MSNVRLLLRQSPLQRLYGFTRAKWPKTALIALAAGFVPAACSAESPVLDAGLDAQLAQAAQPAPPPNISSPYGAYLAGLVARGDGDLEAAAEYMLQALRYDPDNPEILMPALQLAAATGRQSDAAGLAERVLELEGQNSLATLILVVEAAKGGDLQRADDLLAGLPERGFDQVLVPMLRAWTQTGLGDADHEGPDRVHAVLRLLHRQPDQVVILRIDLFRRLGVQTARQVGRADRAVRVLVLQLDPYLGALGVDQFRRLRTADQGHVVTGHEELGAEKRAVGRAENKDVVGHLFCSAFLFSVPGAGFFRLAWGSAKLG